MSKYNRKKTTPVVNTRQGGKGVALNDKLKLVSMLLTGLETRYYEKENDRLTRLKELIYTLDPLFVAKAIVYTRNIIGQRSITHAASAYLANRLSGTTFGRDFFSKWDKKHNKGGVIRRVDDILEIAAAQKYFNKRGLTNAMKKGFSDAISYSDAYELAKYQGKGKEFSLVDIVNMVHPTPNKRNKEALASLIKGELKQFNTAEDKNTKAGQEVAKKVKSGELSKAQAKVVLQEQKANNWKQLLTDGTIGYLALIRNLRNIVLSGASILDRACELIVDKDRIRKSLIWPHQIDIAFEILNDEFGKSKEMTKLKKALDVAYDIATGNLEELGFDGDTAVVFDTSGSMQSSGSFYGGLKMGDKNLSKAPVEKAALIAATLGKGVDGDIYHFATTAEELNYNELDTTHSISKQLQGNIGRVGHGTNFGPIFRNLKKAYKRIFIISDMQGADDVLRNSAYQNYKKKYDINPYIYTVDLCGYGTTMFKQNNNICQLYGYSSHIYESIKKYEVNYDQILKEINQIKLK